MNKLFFVFVLFPVSVCMSQTNVTVPSWDGTDDYIEMGDILNNLSFPFTVEFWVKAELNSSGTSFPVRTSDPRGPRIYAGFIYSIQNGNEIAIHFGDNSGGGIQNRRAKRQVVSNLLGVWHHLAATVEGPNQMNLFVDGINVGGSYEGSASQMIHNPDSMRIGSIRDNTFFKGKLRELRIWNVAKTEREIQDGRFFAPLPASDLVAYWKLTEGSGQDILDSSGNVLTGHLGRDEFTDDADPMWMESEISPISSLECMIDRTDIRLLDSSNPIDSSMGMDLIDLNFINDSNDWIIFGNNSLAAPGYTSNDSESPVMARWNRHWCVDFTDEEIVEGGQIGLVFDFSEAGFSTTIPPSSDVRLVRRNENSGVFEIVEDASGVPISGQTSGDRISFIIDPSTIQNLRAFDSLDGVYTLGVTLVPLPVELVSFEARKKDLQVELLWSTASEKNNSGFELQVSKGGSFEQVAWIEGQGDTEELVQYSYTFEGGLPGDYRFRLKQIDYDGTSEFSEEIELYLGIPGHVYIGDVYPNPATSSVSVEVINEGDRSIRVSALDVAGRAVFTTLDSSNLSSSKEKFEIDTSGWPSGIYFFHVESSVNSKISKVVVRH